MRSLDICPKTSTLTMLSTISITIFLALASSVSAYEDAPLFPLPIDLEEDIGFSFHEDLRHLIDNKTFYGHDDENDEDDEDVDGDEDDDVAFNVFEIDTDEPEMDENDEDDAAAAADSNEPNDDDVLRHKRNKRFVVTRGGSRSKSGSRRRQSSSHSSSSSSHSNGNSRSSSTQEEAEGHGHAEGGGRRLRGIKFTKRFNIRKKSSSKPSKPKTSSSSSPSSKNKHSLPNKPLWQIKWPKKGKTVRSAIQENALFKDEVMKLKLKIGSLTREQKIEILDQHNKYRGQLPGVSGYPISEIPRAQDMQKMVWDDELEKKAKIHAEKCLFAHDTRKERHLDNLIVGQNIAVATFSNNWKTSVDRWYREIQDCNWDLSREAEAKQKNLQCGHYSQVVWSNTSRVGCESAWCPDILKWGYTGWNLVCDYGPGGNYQHVLPYKPARSKGDTCKMCPDNCRDGLCDCKGKICYNGGILHIDTCTCTCNELWKGDDCRIKNCPLTDPEICGLAYPNGYPKAYCDQYANVPNSCPFMCGLCEGAACGGKKCLNRSKLNLKDCTCKCHKIFGGDTCGELKCPKRDNWFCGRTWDKSYCKKFANAPYECPFMCNVCRRKKT